jgi:hypothetical protein
MLIEADTLFAAGKERVSYLEALIETNGYNRYTYEGVAEHLKIQEQVQAILDAPDPDETQDAPDKIKNFKDGQGIKSGEEPTGGDSVDGSEAKTTP